MATRFVNNADGSLSIEQTDAYTVMARGFDGMLRSNEATQKELINQSKEIAKGNEMMSRYLSKADQHSRKIEQLISMGMTASATAGPPPVRTPPSSAPGGGFVEAPGSMGVGGGLPSTQGYPMGRHGSFAEEAAAIPFEWGTMRSMSKMGEAVRSHMFNRLSQHQVTVHTGQGKVAVAQDKYGAFHVAGGYPGAGQYAKVNPNEFNRKQALQGTLSNILDPEREGSVMGAITGGLRGMAGEGLAGGLAAGLGAGVIGGAGVAALGGASLAFLHNQADANNVWRQITGTDQLGAVEDRAKTKLFAASNYISNPLGMGWGDLEKLYTGTRALGLTGSSLGNARNFAMAQNRNSGMGLPESMDIIKTAAFSGQKELLGVADALDGVSKAAKVAGFNVGNTQKEFANAFQLTSTVAGSGAAPSLAATLVGGNINRGLNFQNGPNPDVNSLSFRGRLASESGMTIQGFNAAINAPNGKGGVTFGKVADKDLARISGELLNGQQGLQAMQAYAKANNFDLSDPNQISLHAQDLVKVAGGLSDQIMGALNAYGYPVNDVQHAAQYAIMGLLGVQNYAGTAQNYADSIQPQNIAGPTTKSLQQLLSKGSPRDVRTSVGKNLAKQISDQPTTPLAQLLKTMGAGTNPDQLRNMTGWKKSLIQNVIKSGTVDPRVTALLGHMSDNSQFEVQTANGKKVVGANGLFSDFYDQILQGSAQIVGGNAEDIGKTIAQATNMDPGTNTVTSDKSSGKGLRDLSDWDKKHGGSQGTVTIDLQPWVAQWLQVNVSGPGVVYNQASASGNPVPPNTPSPNSSRQGG